MNLQDLVGFLSRIADDKGAAAADAYLKNNLTEEQINSQDWLSGMRCAFQYSALNEKRRLLSAVTMLGDAGLYLPMEALFELGFPKREFIVNVDLTNGRLGDSLQQLAMHIHAMHCLNLVLFVKSRLSSYRRVLLSKSHGFMHEVASADLTPPVRDYLYSVALNEVFEKTYLHAASPFVLENITSFDGLKVDVGHEAIVLHVRSGDALFFGKLHLPPLSYYKSAIINSNSRRVIVVSEPAHPQDPCVNPVPVQIKSFCTSLGIECILQSSVEIELDAATLFYAKRVVASNSSFSKWLPLYGNSCESLIIPESPNGEDQWVRDACITYINCWDGFDQEKWNDSLDYRLCWVSGESQC